MTENAAQDSQPVSDGQITDQGLVEDPGRVPDAQSQAGDSELGPSNLPPELEETRRQLLRDYHSKTQKIAEERGRWETEAESLRQKADVLDKLMSKQWFQRASSEEQARLNGGGVQFDLTEEQFEQAKNDKNMFKSLVTNMAQQMMNAQVGPALQGQQESIVEIRTNQELDNAVSTYPEIQELIENDDPQFYRFLDEGYDYETAYQKVTYGRQIRQAPSENGPSAEELYDQSRAGSVARTGMPQARGNRVIKAKNFDDAFDQAFAALSRGEKDFTFTRE